MEVLRLGVDFGSSHTAAVLRYPDGTRRPVLFDGFELLPSAVCRDSAGTLVCGRDALHVGHALPGSFEPYPKRCIDDDTVLLGPAEVPVADLVGTVLARVLDEARRVVGPRPLAVTLTHPAGWGPHRLATLLTAAGAAPGLTEARLVAEPVAAGHALRRGRR
ncbi:Hsp70 family protein [Catenuloplanes japonicus]|uniref:hypothetical protein n=1 Tax=Catenuloplanes japonicus TaxID=33876 RepID=UPI0006920A28|nr:hypothetical protein [Catenuloplanes japonicus]